MRTLAAIGWPAALAVPALRRPLPDRDEEVREAAVEGLARLETAPAVGPLLDLCAAPDPPRLRERVGEMIADAAWGPGCERLRDGAWCFRQSVADDHCPAAVREGGAKALGRMGPDAADAVPALLRMLTDPAPGPPQAAARVLGQVGAGPAREAVGPLVLLLADGTAGVRAAAAAAPPRIDPEWATSEAARASLGTLVERLARCDHGTSAVLDAFVLAGPAVVPHLIAALSAPDRNQRESAAVALGASARQPPPPSPSPWPP